MGRRLIPIDRDKLRAAVRKLGNEYVFYMLDDALELLPPAKLHKSARRYLDVNQLHPDPEKTTKPSLLTEVKRFERASLAGDYYESFCVNSKNYTQKSAGTAAWITEFRRHLDRCITSAKGGDPAKVREAMEILFGLLDYIDECHDDVIFFADEGGSWQVGVEWVKVLPTYFKVLSATAQPKEYAERISALVSRHYSYGRDKMLAIAPEPQRATNARPSHRSMVRNILKTHRTLLPRVRRTNSAGVAIAPGKPPRWPWARSPR